MKHTTHRLISTIFAGASLLSAASLAAAQGGTVSTPPAKPGAPAQDAPTAAATAPAPAPLSDEQASYLFGLTFGEQLRSLGASSTLHTDAIDRGIKDALQGKKSTPEEKKQVQEHARSLMMAAAEHNKAAAQEFLTANGTKKGVQTTPSGLQYKVIKAGDAKAPLIVASDEVSVNYRGKLIDGTEFDSSYSRGVPATFPVGGVIKGWQEALVLMKPGANYELYVPPELAYGANPRPGIPANSLLIFNVEVLSVKPKDTSTPAPKTTLPMPPKQPATSQ
jgi:FKBP-type peptidyl-prolyl cis-trans isomerase FklB